VNLIFGAVIDENMGDKVRVTVIATGFEQGGPSRRRSIAAAQREAIQKPAPAPVPVSPSPFEFAVREFDRDDLEIPAFLRKRN